MEHQEERFRLRDSPVFVISIAIVVALIMTTISVLMYYRSDTRAVVDQIQRNNASQSSTVTDIKPEDLTEAYILNVERDVVQNIGNLDNEKDYNPAILTDSALGL